MNAGFTPLLEPIVDELQEADDEEIDHWYCPNCYPDGAKAYCGEDIVGANELEPWADDDDEISCVVCRLVEYCPRCDT